VVLVLTAWAAVTVNFILPRMMPGDPVSTMIAKYQGSVNPNAIDALKLQFGLGTNQSLLSQYFTYLKQICTGNLGISFSTYPETVTSVIRQTLPWTLGLVGVCTILAFVLGVGLGMVAAWRRSTTGWRRGSRVDTFLVPFGVMLGAMPVYWFATMLLYFVAFKLGWFPIGGGVDPLAESPSFFAHFGDIARHSVLPGFTLTLTAMAGWILLMRNTTLTVLGEDFVKFARAKGLPDRTVASRYAARNAILPIFTQFAMALGFVVGGQVFIEIVFSYPGIGYSLLNAVTSQDYPLMQGIFLILTLTILVANFFAEALYVFLDPRVRVEAGK
jgi:peptide/nickel transport system permease protein